MVKRGSIDRRIARAPLGLVAGVTATSLLVGSIGIGKDALADVTQPFPGVTLVDHGNMAMTIANLCSDGVSMRATKYAEREATPQGWATKAGVNADVAINADFFDFPGWTYVVGRARGAGEDWPGNEQNKENRTYWQFGPAMADQIDPASNPPNPAATDIVGGHNTIIRDGHSLAPNFDGDAVILGTYRRTGIGMSAQRSKVYLFASNTALSGASMAADMLAMAAEGGSPYLDVATNQDGGGSSQMYVRGRGQIIDSGRLVNNHLGILAKGSGGTPNCWSRPPTFTGFLPLPKVCGKLAPGEGLDRVHAVTSCDGRFTLIQQIDGNVVVYAPSGKPLWSSGTGDSEGGYEFAMQTDGNLVLYSPYGAPLWSSGSSGHAGAYLAVQDDGNVVVYDGNTALWASSTVDPTAVSAATPIQPLPAAPSSCGTIKVGEGLSRGKTVVSCDGRFDLQLTTDGDLQLTESNGGKLLWSTSTVAAEGYALSLNGDGNLVLYTPFSNGVWTSNSAGHPNAVFKIQDDGNLVVYDGSTPLWNSGTVDKDAPPPLPPSGTGGEGGSISASSGSKSSGSLNGTGETGAGGSVGENGGAGGQGSSGKSGGCSIDGGESKRGSLFGLTTLAALVGVSRRRRSAKR